MRKLQSLFLSVLLAVGPAFAAERTVSSRTNPTGSTTGVTTEEAASATRATTRGTVSRGKPGATSTGTTTGGSNTVATRGATSRGSATTSRTTATQTKNVASRATVSRATTNTATKSDTRKVGDINSDPAVRRAGVVLRPSFADYGGRATIAGTGKQTGSNIRADISKLTNRATTTMASADTVNATLGRMEQTASLNKSCQEQYNECMDQFCAIVDANQKRCSCSANLSRYTKVEKAVTEANDKLNEVAQAIRYVGLSADEIRAIMTETEAEAALDSTRDTSTTRNMLKQIESMIKDPSGSSTSFSSDDGWSFDMDLTFSSDSTDLFSLDFLNTNNNSSSISNLRGTELYNTAKKRCNTILTQCKEVGATQSQITGNYDLAIDRDCLAYEAGLKKMNDTLLSNVKSANLMLQKARLATLENKNQYDARACVSALDSCMRDDMVCGDDYLQCVDPTKTYIDENGNVVLGSDITVIQSFMTKYNNATIDADYLTKAYNTTIDPDSCTGDGKCVVKYLLTKIGTMARATDEGMCRAVLDKCQYYTYDGKTGDYKPYNDIVVNYIQRAMVSIKAAQQKIISDYASSCIVDVASCYNQQISQVTSWASSAGVSNIYNVMRGACRSVALTCGYAVFTGEPTIEPNAELDVDGKIYNVSGCEEVANKTYGSSEYNNGIINCVSNMFYQSLLCPDYSTYVGGDNTVDENNFEGGFVNARCQCKSGYVVFDGTCKQVCGDGQKYSASGTCVCENSNQHILNGVCVDNSETSGAGTESCTVKYACGVGATGSAPSSRTVKVENTVILNATAPECKKTDYAFDNKWEINGLLYNAGDNYTCNTNGTVTATAQWTSTGGETSDQTKTCTVTYNCGEHGTAKSEVSDTQHINGTGNLGSGSTYCTANNGYEFNAWDKGTSYTCQNNNENVTVTAQWKKIEGTLDASDCTCTRGDNVASCERNGVTSDNQCKYKFSCNSGYEYNNQTSNIEWTASEAGVANNTSPNCKAESGGSGGNDNSGCSCSEGNNVTDCTGTLQGDNTCTYTVYCDDGYGQTSGETPSGTGFAVSKQGSTYNAKCEKNAVFNVSLDSKYYADANAAGTGATENAQPNKIFLWYGKGWYSDASTSTPFTKLTTVPQYTDHAFDGFYTGKAGTGEKIIDGQGNIVSGKEKKFTSNGSLYAKWSDTPLQNVTVSFNLNGGDGAEPDEKSCPSDSLCNNVITQSLLSGDTTNFYRAGYVFNGWYTSASGGTRLTETSITVSTDTTYYARWTACAAGTYKAGSGAKAKAACSSCAAGTYTSTTGQSSCSDCTNKPNDGHSSYTGSGDTSSNCLWTCGPGYIRTDDDKCQYVLPIAVTLANTLNADCPSNNRCCVITCTGGSPDYRQSGDYVYLYTVDGLCMVYNTSGSTFFGLGDCPQGN